MSRIINLDKLIINKNYRIEVPSVENTRTILLNSGKTKKEVKFNGITLGTYLGKSIYEDEDEDEDELLDENEIPVEYDEYDEYDNKSDYLFVINNFEINNTTNNTNIRTIDKIEKIKNGTVLLKFIRPETFDPWGRNILLDNVTQFTIQRKWRPSRSRFLEIPDYIANQYLEFYEKVNTEERVLDTIFKQFGIYQPELSYMITNHNNIIKPFWEY